MHASSTSSGKTHKHRPLLNKLRLTSSFSIHSSKEKEKKTICFFVCTLIDWSRTSLCCNHPSIQPSIPPSIKSIYVHVSIYSNHTEPHVRKRAPTDWPPHSHIQILSWRWGRSDRGAFAGPHGPTSC
mmetsp:Transcript_23897/g.46939  ORF Transcript_23897/g.46939 Transcript_23897/m.46939 type:complete len:127 (-) Transcript_23897:94-474(-)